MKSGCKTMAKYCLTDTSPTSLSNAVMRTGDESIQMHINMLTTPQLQRTIALQYKSTLAVNNESPGIFEPNDFLDVNRTNH